MSHIVIDRRLSGKNKSSVNRRRFFNRVREQVRKSIKKIIRDGKIEDVVSDKHETVDIPIKDINEPFFRHGKGGVVERVFPGNKEFIRGDRLPRQHEDQGSGGSEGSDGGDGEDSFTFSISREEFLELFFEDLELPDLIKTNLATVTDHVWRRAGFVVDGSPSRLNVLRSMKQATARRNSLRNPKKKRLEEVENIIKELQGKAILTEEEATTLSDLLLEAEKLRKRIKAIPFIDEIDLRYHNYVKTPIPTTQAVMFCIMDVSGSMGEFEKEMAKRFFMLLYLFLTKNYEKIELVFIRHHTDASEVTEEEFFYSRESGGTVVSPALQLMRQIINDRYNTSQWNIYGCQASDGDNFSSDCPKTAQVLTQEILPLVQYFAYIEISENTESNMWSTYTPVKKDYKNFNMVRITNASDIYPVFRELFEKKE